MVKISAVIITYNEEKYISRCIESVQRVADDILVVDSFSTDKTREICLRMGVRFIERKFVGYSDQKNFAVEQAYYDHILCIDADEFLSDKLVESIQKIRSIWENQAFVMNRCSAYGDRWIRHGNWYPDRQVRMWNRKFGKWDGNPIHEKVNLSKGVKKIWIKGDLLHDMYEDSSEVLQKIQNYSQIFALHHVYKTCKKPNTASIFLHTAWAFFKSYFLKLGFLDGYEGLAVAMSAANHTFYKYAKLYELHKNISKEVMEIKKSPKDEKRRLEEGFIN